MEYQTYLMSCGSGTATWHRILWLVCLSWVWRRFLLEGLQAALWPGNEGFCENLWEPKCPADSRILGGPVKIKVSWRQCMATVFSWRTISISLERSISTNWRCPCRRHLPANHALSKSAMAKQNCYRNRSRVNRLSREFGFILILQ